MAMPFPWQARSTRHEAIEAARGEKEQSLGELADAKVIQRQIERMAEQNHFAATIAEQIIRRHQQGHGGT
jgi:hypothetical protein